MARVVVTTCPKYKFLLQGFVERFSQFWKQDFLIDIAKEEEPWSDQLIRICQSLHQDYFIRLCEDFYLQEPVDSSRIKEAEHIAWYTGAARVGLQCVEDGYRECSEIFAEGYFKLKNNAQYLCSLEASIWNKNFLLKHLEPGLNIWEEEIRMSNKSREENPLILIPEKPIVIYKDATRRGELRI